eukprot:5144186-Amphidinium_carterae.1
MASVVRRIGGMISFHPKCCRLKKAVVLFESCNNSSLNLHTVENADSNLAIAFITSYSMKVALVAMLSFY